MKCGDLISRCCSRNLHEKAHNEEKEEEYDMKILLKIQRNLLALVATILLSKNLIKALHDELKEEIECRGFCFEFEGLQSVNESMRNE